MIIENTYYHNGEFYFFVADFTWYKEGTEYFIDEFNEVLVNDKDDHPVHDYEIVEAIENSIERNLKDYV